MQEPGPRPPDPRRLRVVRLLRERIGANAAQFFIDAARLVDGEVDLETSVHLIGHCAREIESAVREVAVVLLPTQERLAEARREGKRTRATHRGEILAIVEAVGLPADSDEVSLWLELAAGSTGEIKGLAAMTHRRAHEPAPPIDDDTRDLWRRFEGLLVVLLREIESRFAALLPRLRELAARVDPGPAALGLLRELPNTYVTRREFFDNASAAWFPVLEEAGMFENPPQPIQDPETGTTQLQHWPAADYLARMAALPEHQERFLRIASRMDVPHEFAARTLLLGAGSLPTALRARFAGDLARWISAQRHLFLIGNDVALFVAGLAQEQPTAAVAPLEEVLALEPDPEAERPREGDEAMWFRPRPRARLEDYDYEHVIERAFPPLVQEAPRVAFATGLRLLTRALVLSERRELVEREDDTSMYWMPSVAAGAERYGGHDHAALLAHIVRDAAIAAVRADPAQLDQLLADLRSGRWPLPRRIALHVLAVIGDIGRIREALLDPDLLKADWPEYRTLSREHFAGLSEEDRRAHVRLVEERRPRQNYASGDPIDQEDAVRWHEAWLTAHLREIEPGLPDDIRERYASRLREQPRPAESQQEVAVVDPLNGDALAALSIDELRVHLATWQSTGRLGAPSLESQAGSLREAVARDPARYAAAAEAFIGLDPTYVRHVLWGLQQAVEGAATFDWAPVLALAEWVLDQPSEEGAPRSGIDRDPGWMWARKEIADLLRAALEPSAPRVSLEYRWRIWSVIGALTEGAEDESDGDTSGEGDPVDASLNSTRGSALHGAIEYSQWVLGDDFSRPAMQVVPEVAILLEHRLDPANDRSRSTRGAIGSRLAQLVALDRAWVEAQRDRLLPREDPALARLTWLAYVRWNAPRRDVIELFRSQYLVALKETAARVLDKDRNDDPERRLVDHVLMAYIRGWIAIDDELVTTLYDSAPARLRAHGTEYVGRVLKDSRGDLTVEHCERIRALWAYRLQTLAERTERAREELEQFGWWFRAGECGDDWLLAQLLAILEITGSIVPESFVMDRLAELAPAWPLEAAIAVDLLTVQPRRQWFVQASISEITTVLRTALTTELARERAVAVINRLIADGHRGLEGLL